MARFRLSGPAQADLAHILDVSTRRWGRDGRRRYAALLAATMRKIAAQPRNPATRARAELSSGLRSFHTRFVRLNEPAGRVRRSVHVLFYREVEPNVIEIVRVLHERMDPREHLQEMRDSED